MIPYSVNPPFKSWTEPGEPVREYPYGHQLFNWVSGTAGTVAGLAYLGMRDWGGERGFTKAYRFVSATHQFIPFLGPSLQVPSIISPFIEHSKFAPAVEMGGRSLIPLGKGFVGSQTLEYLERITGLNAGQLSARSAGGELFWERTGRISGRLVSRSSTGTLQTVSEGIALLHAYDPNIQVAMGQEASRMNRFAQAHLSVIDQDLAASIFGFPPKPVLPGDLGGLTPAEATKRVIPWHPSVQLTPQQEAQLRTLPEFIPIGWDRTGQINYLRTFPAWASQRMNELVRTITKQVPIIGDLLPTLRLGVKEGPFLNMQFRYAGTALKLGLAWMGVQQLDWFKRQEDSDILAGAAYGGVVGGVLHSRFKTSPRVTGLATLATGLVTMTPPFEEGVVPGLATLWTKLQLTRSNISSAPVVKYMPFIGHEYREFMEEAFPGATTATTAAFAGLAALGGSYLYREFQGAISPSSMREWAFHMQQTGRDPLWFRGPGGGVLPSSTWFDAAKQSWSRAIHTARGDVISPRRMAQGDLDKQIADDIYHTKGFFPKAWKQIQAAWSGASADSARILQEAEPWWKAGYRRLPFGPNTLRFLTGFMAFGALTGLFASKEDPEELRRLYSGEQLQAVRRGRFWGGGGTPFEGTDVLSWRPHWYARLMTRAKERSLWGPDEDEISPFNKFMMENFSYELERRTYKTRPSPLSNQALADVPFVGWLLSPIGRLIKPARIMHPQEWIRVDDEGNVRLADIRRANQSNPMYELGGLPQPSPVSPFAGKSMLGEAVYSWTEQAGLVGWLSQLWMRLLGGTETPYSQDRWLDTAGRASSFRREFWEMQLGGIAGTSEPIRRYLPKHRREIEYYNPVPNILPGWTPETARWGDPYIRWEGRYAAIPGPGYASMHPELEGMDPEEYPLAYRYDILSQVAPFSKEFRSTQRLIQEQSASGLLTQKDLALINNANQRLKISAQRREFNNPLSVYNEDTQELGAVSGLIRGRYIELLSKIKNLASPLEYVSPLGFRPFSKFLPLGDAISEYERTQAFGTSMSFWDKPWRDWFRPALTSAAHFWGGTSSIPGWQQSVRDTNEYFDKLEYYKWDYLQQRAESEGNRALGNQYKRLKENTLYGVNPYDTRELLRILPAEQRDYFPSFEKETDPVRRERIVELVPNYMRNIYLTRWRGLDAKLSGDESAIELVAEEQANADLVRRAELSEYFKTHPLPRPDWSGFNASVDLEDVKLKVVQMADSDIHDYGLWESDERLLARKPYINEDLVDQMYEPSTSIIRSTVQDVLSKYGINNSDVSVRRRLSSSPRTDINVEYRDSREEEIHRLQRQFDL